MGGFSTKKENQQSGSTSVTGQNAQNSAWNNAMNQSVQGSVQDSFNQANQQATSQTGLYGAQAPFLQSLWGQANALSGADPGVAAQARNAWQGALGAGINPGVADVIQNASADMGLNFSRNTLPGIRQGAVGTGSLGGSRQGIAEGLAAGEPARNQSNMATTLYTQALDQASRERTAALSMSGAMQNLPWQGLESFGRVLGGPILESYGQSGGSSFGSSAGSSYGQSYGQSAGASQGTSSAFGSTDAFGQGSGSGFGLNVLSKGNSA